MGAKTKSASVRQPQKEQEFKPDDLVTHKFSGFGVVRKVKHTPGGLQCFVQFGNATTWTYASMLKPAKAKNVGSRKRRENAHRSCD